MYRVYENKTDRLIKFDIMTYDANGEHHHNWHIIRPGESANIEYSIHPQSISSFEKAEKFGLTLKSGSVQDITKVPVPPEILPIILQGFSKGDSKKWLIDVLRDDVAIKVHKAYPSFESLKNASVSDLVRINGVGEVTARKIKKELGKLSL